MKIGNDGKPDVEAYFRLRATTFFAEIEHISQVMRSHITTIIAWILSLFGIALIVFFAFNKSFNDGSGIINADVASSYGSFIGGLVGPIISLAGFILLYETIITQRNTFQIQQFESKFFELVRYHRENVNNMEHKVPSADDRILKGGAVFIELKKQMEELLSIVKPILTTDSKLQFNNIERETINVAYLICFYGVAKNAISSLKTILFKRYSTEVVNTLIDECIKKKTIYDRNIVYFGGHQSRLGHYFRHLFQTVSFVDRTKFLTNEQKYQYVKLLRAQLTTYEQALF